MKQYARIAEGVVAEIVALPEGVAVVEAFHPDIAATLVPAPATVAEGWLYDGQRFTPSQPPDEAPPQRRFTFLEFMDLFTAQEREAVVAASDTKIKLFLLMAAGASYIDLDDARTAASLQVLVDTGLLTAARRAAVLAGQAPA
jgi:hypothetical protein